MPCGFSGRPWQTRVQQVPLTSLMLQPGGAANGGSLNTQRSYTDSTGAVGTASSACPSGRTRVAQAASRAHHRHRAVPHRNHLQGTRGCGTQVGGLTLLQQNQLGQGAAQDETLQRGTCQGGQALAHLGQAAGLKHGGHQDEVAGGVDEVRQRLVKGKAEARVLAAVLQGWRGGAGQGAVRGSQRGRRAGVGQMKTFS